MAFFNLTHLGPQDPFKTASKKYTEGEKEVVVTDRDTTAVSADSGHASTCSCTHSYYNTMYSPSVDPSWHRGSHLKYTEMLKKHQKSPEGMICINCVNWNSERINGHVTIPTKKPHAEALNSAWVFSYSSLNNLAFSMRALYANFIGRQLPWYKRSVSFSVPTVRVCIWHPSAMCACVCVCGENTTLSFHNHETPIIYILRSGALKLPPSPGVISAAVTYVHAYMYRPSWEAFNSFNAEGIVKLRKYVFQLFGRINKIRLHVLVDETWLHMSTLFVVHDWWLHSFLSLRMRIGGVELGETGWDYAYN